MDDFLEQLYRAWRRGLFWEGLMVGERKTMIGIWNRRRWFSGYYEFPYAYQHHLMFQYLFSLSPSDRSFCLCFRLAFAIVGQYTM